MPDYRCISTNKIAYSRLKNKLRANEEISQLICSAYDLDIEAYRLLGRRVILEAAYGKTLAVANNFGLISIKSCSRPFKRIELQFATVDFAKQFAERVKEDCRHHIVCQDCCVFTPPQAMGDDRGDFKYFALCYVLVGYSELFNDGCHTFNQRRYQKRLRELDRQILETLGGSRSALDLILGAD